MARPLTAERKGGRVKNNAHIFIPFLLIMTIGAFVSRITIRQDIKEMKQRIELLEQAAKQPNEKGE